MCCSRAQGYACRAPSHLGVCGAEWAQGAEQDDETTGSRAMSRTEPVAGSNRRILPRSEAQKRSMSGSRKVHMWVAHDAKGRERTLVGEQCTCMVTILCSMSYATSSLGNVGTLLTRHAVVCADVDSNRASESPHSRQRGRGMAARRGMKALSACGALRRCFVAAHAQQQASSTQRRLYRL